MAKFSSQKHHWKTKASAKCRSDTEWRATNNFIGLKNIAPKTQSENFTSSSSQKFPYPIAGLNRPCIRAALLREVPSSSFHLSQMPISPQTRRQDMGGHLQGRNHLMGFCIQKHGFCNAAEQNIPD